MADITDSPISRLSATTALSAEDLFLVSKQHTAAGGERTYTSNQIRVDNAVSSFITYMTGPLSSYLSSCISSFVNPVILKEWTHTVG